MVDRLDKGRVAFFVTMLAVLYGVALLAWTVAIPAVDGKPLLEYGGPWSLAITAQPLLFSLLLWAILHRRCTTGSGRASLAAHVLAPLYLLYSVLGGFTIAFGALPAACLLAVAVRLTPRGPARASAT